jgi:hypothetical protein
MKRLFLLVIFLMAGVVAQAAPKGPLTLDEWIAKRKANAEKKGEEYDEAKAKASFEKKDLDKDGKLSVEEQASKKEKAE